jgi:hypothetical protein
VTEDRTLKSYAIIYQKEEEIQEDPRSVDHTPFLKETGNQPHRKKEGEVNISS